MEASYVRLETTLNDPGRSTSEQVAHQSGRIVMIEPLRILQTTPQLTASIPLKVPREEIRHVMGPALASNT